MTGESLNIKIRLDFSDVKSGVQKVKSQLAGMANTVKQSIPRINTESKKAEKSLSQVGSAGDRVKKSLSGIGDEAKKSLSGVVNQSNKFTQALNAMGIASNKARSTSITGSMAESTDEARLSLEELHDTMSDILSLNFFGLLSKTSIGSGFKKHIADLKAEFADLAPMMKSTIATMFEMEREYRRITKNIPTVMVKRHTQEVRKLREAYRQLLHLQIDMLSQKLKPVIKDIGLMALKITGLVGAITAVIAVINALQVSKLGKEMYTASQQAGFAAQSYQEWQYVLERTGVEASELKEVMKTLTESQTDVLEGNEDMIEAYKKLGMSVKDVVSMNQEELWTNTIKALQNIENTTERTAIAYKLFSEDTSKLTTVLNLTNKETQELINTYNELGGAMSKELVTNSNVLQGSLVNLRAAWQGLKNTLAQAVLPAVILVVEWITKAIVVVNAFLQAVFNLDLTPMTENLSSGMNNASGSIEGIGSAADSATEAVEKLKRTTMGFDELNIVTDPNSKSSGSDSDSSTDISLGNTNLGSIGTGNSIFMQASKEAEELKQKIKEFIDEFENQIKIIGTALGALGIAKLLGNLGEAIGLGDKFLTAMKAVQKIAATAITIVLQYEFVNEFMDRYLDGKGFKNYLMGLLVAAIGTGVLYSMWGPAGLVIGLGVTAVASFKAVLDNGGIKDVESLTVALTSLAAACGAVYTAWTKLGLGKLITSLGTACAGAIGNIAAFFSLLKESGSLTGTLAAAFPKLSTAIGGAAKAVGIFISGLSVGTLAAIAAAVIAVGSAAYSLYQNWDKVVQITKDWIKQDIKPLLDDIKESWDKLKKAVAECGKALWDCIPEWLQDKLKDIWGWVVKTYEAFKDWLESIEWIDLLEKAIEGLGGIIVGLIGGTVMGVLTGIVQFIEGLIQNISGWVQFVSGAIEAIVKLFTGDLDGARKAAQKIWDGICDIFQGAYDATIGVIVKWVKGIIKWCTELWDELVGHSIIPDMVEDIMDWFDKLYDNTIGVIVDWVKDIIAKLKKMWSDIKSWFDSNVAPKLTKQYWQDKFDAIKQGASDKLTAAKKTVTDTWSSITTWFKQNVAPKFTLSYWTQKFENVRKAASEKFGEVKKACTSAWSSVSSWFTTSVKPKFTLKYWSDKFSVIKDGAKSAFNGLIGIVESAVNGIIDKINTLSWRIPDWVPYYGGSSFGFNFRRVNIPRLAQGGIVTESTLANIGERGAEAVLPLTGQQGSAWMDMLAGKIAAQIIGTGNRDVVIKIGETEFGRASVNAINGYMKQTGGLALA